MLWTLKRKSELTRVWGFAPKVLSPHFNAAATATVFGRNGLGFGRIAILFAHGPDLFTRLFCGSEVIDNGKGIRLTKDLACPF